MHRVFLTLLDGLIYSRRHKNTNDSGSAAASPSAWDRWPLLSPAAVCVGRRERLRVAAGAFLGILVAAMLCRAASALWGVTPWLGAPLDASAMLVFAMPTRNRVGACR
jgi:CBS-domain-containing membrane protein